MIRTPSPLLQRTIDHSALFFQQGCPCCGCRCRNPDGATLRKWNLLLQPQWDRNIDRKTNNGDAGAMRFGHVHALAIGPDDSVYAAGETRNSVNQLGFDSLVKFDPEGRCVKEVFARRALSLALRGDALVVGSWSDNGTPLDVHKYDLDLNHQWSHFINTMIPGVCIDASGNIYCVQGPAQTFFGDPYLDRQVYALDAAGNDLWQYGTIEGFTPYWYNCICTDDTYLYCGSSDDEFGTGKGVQVLDLEGNPIDFIETAVDDVRAIAVRNGMLVTGAFGAATCNLQAFDTSDFSTLWTRSRPYPSLLHHENGSHPNIAIGSDGLIYTVGAYPGLMIFDAGGDPVSCHDHHGTPGGSRFTAGVAVSDVALVTGGNGFFCGAGGTVSCPDASCTTTATTTTAE